MILDTNGISDLADGHAELTTIIVKAGTVEIPSVVLGEYRFGLAWSRDRNAREHWLKQLLDRFSVLDITNETSTWYADIRSELRRAGQPVPTNDVWIAALCRQHNLPLLSRDKHFDYIPGLQRITW